MEGGREGPQRPCQAAQLLPACARAPILGGWPWRQRHLEGGERESTGHPSARRRGKPGKSGRLSEAPLPTVCQRSGRLGARGRAGGGSRLRGRCSPAAPMGTEATPGPPWLRREDQGNAPGLTPPPPPTCFSLWSQRRLLTLYNPHPSLQGRPLSCFNYFEFQYVRV